MLRSEAVLCGRCVAAALLILCTGSAPASGQLLEFADDLWTRRSEQRDPFEERIETERHDFTQSAVTVGEGVVQFEAGYTYFYADIDDVIESAHTTPELFARYGISEDIEFRVRANYAWIFIDEEEDEQGWEDLRYSMKLQVTRQRCGGLRPTSALEIRASAPTGGRQFTTGQSEFGLDYIYQWLLFEGFTVAGSTGFLTNGLGDFGLLPDEPDKENFNTISQSAVVGLELSESNTMYAEWFGLFSDGLEEEFAESYFNIGIDHYMSDNFVVDFRIGVGLTHDSDDLFVGVGGGYRF